jgi:subfamily B ATP-binding cassette protein MsbA
MEDLKKLWPYIKPYRNGYILVILLGLFMSACDTGVAALIRPLFDEVFTKKNDALKLSLSLSIVAVYFFHGVARFFHTTKIKMIVEYITANIRMDLQKKLIRLNLNYHSLNSPAVSLSKAFNDVGNVQYGLWKLADLVKEPLSMVFLLGWVIYLDWKLTLMIFIVIPVMIKFLKQVARSARKYSHFQQKEFENVMTAYKESLDGVRIVQSYNLEKLTEKKLLSTITKYLDIRKIIVNREEIAGPVTEFLGAVTFAGVLYYKATQVIDGHGTTGDFMSYLAALAFIQKPIKNLQDAFVRFQNMLVAAVRVDEVLKDPNEVPQSPNPVPFPKAFESIQFKNVGFSYTKGLETLKNVNISIKKGEIVALVGESGSGKSTLMNLLERFYDPTHGQILVDNTPINEIDLTDLRRHIALVTQDVFLFDDSVADNIRSGNTEQESVSVEESAKLANAFDFISKGKDQFEGKAGDRGAKFSGGEKQRLSIARAIYKNAPVLILDEATSALDSKSELEVQKGLEQLMRGRTVFVIAHRLSTIIKADRIIVMRNGEVVETGNHSELLTKKGAYYNFYQLQAMS